MAELKQVTIYTDGAAAPANPGPGGWAAVLSYTDAGGKVHTKELSGGYLHSTNNRCELWAVVHALHALKQPCRVTVVSNSTYVVQGAITRLEGPKAGIGKRKRKRAVRYAAGLDVKGRPLVNGDLWQLLLAAAQPHQVTFRWVRGHSGDPVNERCDQLAEAACHLRDRPVDTGHCLK